MKRAFWLEPALVVLYEARVTSSGTAARLVISSFFLEGLVGRASAPEPVSGLSGPGTAGRDFCISSFVSQGLLSEGAFWLVPCCWSFEVLESVLECPFFG
jgi:hypothetical protein